MSWLFSDRLLGHHYHYTGSLTTAPFTESVDWFVLKKVYEASPEQIETINKIEGNNARHIEPQNDRLVDDE
ncbi:MAG: carbonic anhydrase family protein [Methylomicrobium sp.]|nr:carbonic anhydrase family protein [Methylomicrobium sp.]